MAWVVACIAMGVMSSVARAEHRVIALSVANGVVRDAGDTVRVKQGDDVELRWTSDKPMTLHLHGYEIEAKVAPGKTAVMAFKATIPGRFPVHDHVGHEHRAVLYVEVYPS